jgi:cytochrome c oxidase assembly protein subunit 15
LALLTGQAVALSLRDRAEPAFSIPSGLRLLMASALSVLVLQVLSGAWVSTNYAVLACTDFPLCQGQWWPMMDFARGFEIWRPLGLSQDGSPLSFQALTAIHFSHRYWFYIGNCAPMLPFANPPIGFWFCFCFKWSRD